MSGTVPSHAHRTWVRLPVLSHSYRRVLTHLDAMHDIETVEERVSLAEAAVDREARRPVGALLYVEATCDTGQSQSSYIYIYIYTHTLKRNAESGTRYYISIDRSPVPCQGVRLGCAAYVGNPRSIKNNPESRSLLAHFMNPKESKGSTCRRPLVCRGHLRHGTEPVQCPVSVRNSCLCT